MNESSLIQVMEYLIANEFYDAYDGMLFKDVETVPF